MRGSFKHGPVDAGYCTVCHDPHASEKADGLRKSVWDLCVTCHFEKVTEKHVLVGMKKKRNLATRQNLNHRGTETADLFRLSRPHSGESSHLFIRVEDFDQPLVTGKIKVAGVPGNVNDR
jgi:predicted CXXCH cytochrome family protein